MLKKVPLRAIYFHVFEARLRLEKGINDFSYWIEDSIGNAALARKISGLDPYSFTIERLRQAIIDILEKG